MFSPRREVPFAGHPSVGTAHAVLEAGLATPRDGLLVQEGIAGLLPLRVDGRRPHAHDRGAHAARAGDGDRRSADDPRLRAALRGLPLGALPPALMDGGRRWWLAELADEAALRAATPDWDAIAALAQATESMGLCVFARSARPGLLPRGARLRRRAGAVRGRGLGRGQRDARRLAGVAATRCRAPTAVIASARAAKSATTRSSTCTSMRDGEVWSGGRVCDVVSGHIDWSSRPLIRPRLDRSADVVSVARDWICTATDPWAGNCPRRCARLSMTHPAPCRAGHAHASTT